MNYMALKQYTKIMDIGFKSLDAVLDFYITLLLFVKLVFRAKLLSATPNRSNKAFDNFAIPTPLLIL